jgi:hypothetical protein
MHAGDREDIKNMITAALTANRKAGFWWKESLEVAVVAALAAFLVYQYIPEKIASQTASLAADVSSLKADVRSNKADVAEIRKDIKDELIRALDGAREDAHKEASGRAPKRSALEFGTRILTLAENLKVRIEEPQLRRYGSPIVKAALTSGSLDPKIQSAASTILNYRSFIGSQDAPDISQAKPSADLIFDSDKSREFVLSRYPAESGYLYFAVSGGGTAAGITGPVSMLGFTIDDANRHFTPLEVLPKVLTLGVAPTAKAATIELLNPWDDPVPNRIRAPNSAEYIVVEAEPGTTIFLDRMRFKNVILVNSRVSYHGGPTLLENVIFSNCTFAVRPTPRAAQFAESVLAPGTTNFRG